MLAATVSSDSYSSLGIALDKIMGPISWRCARAADALTIIIRRSREIGEKAGDGGEKERHVT